MGGKCPQRALQLCTRANSSGRPFRHADILKDFSHAYYHRQDSSVMGAGCTSERT